MVTKRSYEDGCAAAHGLDLVGERWALLVVRELILGPKRFTDLRAGLPSISPNVLTERLEELERSAVLVRRKLPPPAGSWVYELTEWGRELEPTLMALGRWAARSPSLMEKPAPMGVDSLILSFRTMFDPRLAEGLDARGELRFGDDRFQARIAGGHLEIARGAALNPDFVIDADSNTLAAIVYGGHKLSEAARVGQIRIEGDKAAARRFLTLFPMPQPARASIT